MVSATNASGGPLVAIIVEEERSRRKESTRPIPFNSRSTIARRAGACASLRCRSGGLGRGAGTNHSELAHHLAAERVGPSLSSSSPGFFVFLIFPEPVLGQPSALGRRRPTELLGGPAKARRGAL